MRLIDIDDISLRKTIACGGLSAKALWRRIQQQPTIDAVEVVRGEWKNYKDEHYCTNCGEVVIGDWYDTDDWYDFCPWCGARMKGIDDE